MKMFFIQDCTGRGFTSEKMGEDALVEFAEETELERLIYFSRTASVGDSIMIEDESARVTRIQDRESALDVIKFLKSSFGESQKPLAEFTTDLYFFDVCKYKIRRHKDGDFSCVVGNREVRSRNPFQVVAELLEFIQAGEEK